MTTSRSVFRKWLAGMATALVVVASLALIAQDAEAARRIGGGKSFGRQTMSRDQATPPARTPAQDAAAKPGQQQSPATAPAPAGNRWMGALGGLAAGLGIAALLSHFGLGGAFASALGSMLMLALLIFGGLFLWRMIKRSAYPQTGTTPLRQAFEAPASGRMMGSGATTNAYGAPVPGAQEQETAQAAVDPADSNNGIPADFDVEGFLRIAKVNFNRLQAAWDARDLDDIRKFTTPEVYAEIKMQRDEAGDRTDRTEVENLNAKLLGIETTAEDYVASVRFSGTLRDSGETPDAFEEVWNLVKPVNGRAGWLLGGIQQVH